jgi:hypothetical protein
MSTGKGWFIWQIARCEGGDPQAIAVKAKEAGCTHVLLKVAERNFAFGFDQFKRDLVPPVAAALRAQGIEAWGWHYVYGDQPLKEAEVAVSRTRELGLAGYVINAEIEYKHPAKFAAARQYMRALRQGLPDTPSNCRGRFFWRAAITRCRRCTGNGRPTPRNNWNGA